MRPVLLLPMLLGAALAGCADDGPDRAGPSSIEEARGATLAVGAGAIAGLVIDDRFRPLHVTPEGGSGPFAPKGFILVQETGRRLSTNVDGEFFALDLRPGTYTLRPNVEGHEGTPQKVTVRAGEFAEANVLVRRVLSPGDDFVFVEEETLLLTCMLQVASIHLVFGRTCMLDMSGDGTNNWVDLMAGQQNNISAAVIELRFSEVADWELWFGPQLDVISADQLYGRPLGFGTDYMRVSFVQGEPHPERGAQPTDFADFRSFVWPAGPPMQETGTLFGLDWTFQAKARIVSSAFLAMPDDFETYAVLA